MDCTNLYKSKLEDYNYLKDKFLNYCVVKVPKKKKVAGNGGNRTHNEMGLDTTIKNSVNFKNFLESKKSEIISQARKIR